jgi:DNA/RNA endonuclease G (NUC1)
MLPSTVNANITYLRTMKQILTAVLLMATLWSWAQHTITVKHTYYTVQFDTVLKSPLISWYIQTTAHATSTNKIDRKTVAAFHQDPLISAKYQVANDAEYLNNGKYDKGHLSPYSAFYFDLTAAKESMFYTNTAPQYSFFNEHPYERLEQHILKDLAIKFDSIYVYTGCIYGGDKMKYVPIPIFYWKVIKYGNKLEGWLCPNEVTSNSDYTRYGNSITDIRKTILQHYPNLKLPF